MGKDLQTLNGQNKLALWEGRISECRNSGQNVKAWCRENGVCEQTYYKWQRRLFELAQAQQEVQFANGLDPYNYLTWLLKTAKDADLTNEQTIQALLPWNASSACRTKKT